MALKHIKLACALACGLSFSSPLSCIGAADQDAGQTTTSCCPVTCCASACCKKIIAFFKCFCCCYSSDTGQTDTAAQPENVVITQSGDPLAQQPESVEKQ